MFFFNSFCFNLSIAHFISNISFVCLLNHNSVLQNNFYVEDYFISLNDISDLSLEIILVVFIFYNLVSLFNDENASIFQYHKWLTCFYFLFFVLFLKVFNYNLASSKLTLGFSWITSYYVLISKLTVLGLTIIILWIIQRKVQIFLNSSNFSEFPLVLGFSVLFMFLLLSSYDFVSTYLTLEGLSLTLYVLAILLNQGIVSVESAIKYFSLGAISSGSLILGISILFGFVGSTDFLDIQTFLGSQNSLHYSSEIVVSILLILFAFFFKISAFPCHVWVADVYEGIWSPITAFFAIVIKVCLLLVFIKLVFDVFFNVLIFFQPTFILASLGSMIIGALGALKQVRIKRFLAYTSINQIGFILLGVSSCSLMGLLTAIMYLALYIVMNLIFFSVFLHIEHAIIKRNVIYLSDLYGISYYSKESSTHLVITIMSMAGLPPLGGFIGKLFIYFSAIEARLDFSLIITLAFSILSAYYYLNFVRYVFFENRSEYKLYYYINNNKINLCLRIFSIFLVSFPMLLSMYFDFFIKVSFSCIWPFIYG